MARSDLLLNLVRAGAKGDQPLFRATLEALVAEERAKQHHVLADRLALHLQQSPNAVAAPSLGSRLGAQLSELFYEVIPRRVAADLILNDVTRTAVREVVEEHSRADVLRAHNLEPRNRILLIGPPGNGKTTLAEALASELAVSLLVVRYEAVIASYLGETAVRLARLFEQVRTRKCVLFFDEFDVVGKERGDVHETGEIKRVVSSLLLQVDALPSYVVVVAATNHAELLDRAAWRRFQLRLEMPLPTPQQTLEWVERFEARLGAGVVPEVANLAKRLRGLSFSDLDQFGEDVQRRFVLGLPNADLRRILSDRLKQWEARLTARISNRGPKRDDK